MEKYSAPVQLYSPVPEQGAAIVSIEAVTPTRVKEYISSAPIVGFGYPVHCSDLPQPMKDFMGSLPPQQGKAAFVFCTQWLWSGDQAHLANQTFYYAKRMLIIFVVCVNDSVLIKTHL